MPEPGVDHLSNIERCWIWTTRDEASGQSTRGVMFHEPGASRAYVNVEEFVPASQLRGAVGDRDWLAGIVYEFLLSGPRKRHQLHDVEMKRFLAIRRRGGR